MLTQRDCLQELLDHLEGMLSNEAVVVTVGQAIVEVKPQVGVSMTCLCWSIPTNMLAALGTAIAQASLLIWVKELKS